MTRILIIDDAVHIRRLVTRMLEQVDFTTIEAADGVEGLRVLKEQRPDVVICDISMPVMNGHEFLNTVRNDPQLQHIPVIIITAMGQEEEAAISLMKADAYLTKPFSSSQLIETIYSQLNKNKAEEPNLL